MNKLKTTSFLVAIILLGSLLSFKSKDVKLLPTKLKITVLDGLGNVVEGATVSIYNTEENYRDNKKAIATTTTDAKGVALFKDLKTISYYIDARKGDLNNDAEGVKTAALLEGKTNKVNTIIE